MDYELCKKLKDAGFPYIQKKVVFNLYEKVWKYVGGDEKNDPMATDPQIIPTLSELIEACGDKFNELIRYYQGDGFLACASGLGKDGMAIADEGKTPDEAVAKLWLELNDKTIQ